MRTRLMFRNGVQSLGLSAALIGALASSALALTLNVTDDTYTDDQNSLQPLGGNVAIQVGNIGGRNQAGFVRFDLTPLPAGATVTQAFLRVFVHRVNLLGPAGTINIFELNGAWKESTLNIANTPPKFPTPMFSFSVAPSDAKTFMLIDGTQAVQDWLSGATTNNGITLVPSNTSAISIGLNRQGIGASLVNDVFDEARAAGLPVRLSVVANNAAALRFYLRLGFRPIESSAIGMWLEWRDQGHKEARAR